MNTSVNFFKTNVNVDLQNAPTVVSQQTIWRGERCVVYAPAESLLKVVTIGAEEIAFGLSEYAEKSKVTQDRQQRLGRLRKRRDQKIAKVVASATIRNEVQKRKGNDTADDTE